MKRCLFDTFLRAQTEVQQQIKDAGCDGGPDEAGHFWSDPFHSFLGGGFGSLWNDMLGEAAPTATLLGTERKCPTCGMTESELRRTGRVGCPDCYSTFADILNPYVQKVHGATRHVGTAPAAPEQPKTDPVADLKAQLKAAVESEDYERAASLRDEIRRMEGEQK